MKFENIAQVYRELTRGQTITWLGDPDRSPQATIAIRMDSVAERPKLKYLTPPLPPMDAAALAQVALNVESVIARDAQEALAKAPEVHAAHGSFVTPELVKAAK